MKPFRKTCGIPIPLAIVIGLILTYAWIFMKPTYLVWLVKNEAAHNPSLAVVPVPLSDTSISAVQGTTLTAFGYQFDVPWKMKELKHAGAIAIFASEPEQEAIMFWDPAKTAGLVKIMKDSPGTPVKEMAVVYGENTIRSNYDFHHALVNSTPSELSYFLPGRTVVRAAVLLMLKPMEMIDAETGIYSFNTEHLRGFQNGDPAKAKNVMIKAYDSEDREFQFVFGSKVYPSTGLTQADINLALQSLRPVPVAQPDEPANPTGK
jgi:hypothetical protein